ncbi:MAG: phosphoglucomutase/phosphomannomutase family protein [Elusimicrobia bacterium]|nr:phosphoglucomutase/phosphomannomutase family protein [Elusimicrobiota bacterium]
MTIDVIKFGTDGWRGLLARDFTFDNVRRVIQALADFIRDDAQKTPAKRKNLTLPIWIGYDRRFQSESFAREVARVLKGNRLNPFLLAETLPTPAVSLLTFRSKGLGIVVTASHNPPQYNGIKIKSEGRTVPEGFTRMLEAHMDKTMPALNSDFPVKSCRDLYLQYLRARVPPARILPKLRHPVVIDYLHGSGAGIMEKLLPSKNLIAIRTSHDPLFGGVNPEPIEANLGLLIEKVRQSKAFMGIALDGDADRVGVVDEKGTYYTPCQVYPLLIEYLVEAKKLRGKIVQSVSMGYLSARIARGRGLPFEEVPVGFKYVAEKLASGEAVIGAEESGGYAWKGGLPERDGLVTALMLIEMCLAQGRPLSALWKQVEAKYGASSFKRLDLRIHRPVADKTAFAAKLLKKLPKKLLGCPIKETVQLDGLKVILEGEAWVLVRPSGTEPVMRLYAETDAPQRTTDLLEVAKKWVAVGHG